MKGVIVFVLVSSLLLIASCSSVNELTGGVVGTDSCSFLDGLAKDDCYFESKKCSKIETKSVLESCVAELAIQKQDLSVCDLITSESTKGYCKSTLASKTNNVEVCTTIVDGYWKDNCHFEYATSRGEGVFCSAINTIDQQQDCFFKVATTINSLEFCEVLPSARADTCVFKIAQNTKDIAVCNAVQHPLSKDACRLKLASRILNDTALCDTIKAGAVKETCLERFEEN